MSLLDADLLNRYFRKHFHPEATFSVASSGLKPEELNQKDFELYNSFPSEKRKKDFLMGRKALYDFFDDPKENDFIGKTHPRYSLSHSKGNALAYDSNDDSFSGVGVDLEFWRDSLVKSRYLYSIEEEWKHCESKLDYLKLWVSKEAIYKAVGDDGLRLLDIKIVSDKASKYSVAGQTVSYCTGLFGDYAISAAYSNNCLKMHI